MKYVKILGLLAVAAAALMAFAGTAAATTVKTTTSGAAATPTIHAVNEGGHAILANSVANIECSMTLEGTVDKHGNGVTAHIKISKLEFTGCTNSWHVTTAVAGYAESHYTSGHNGVLTSLVTSVDTTRFFVPCNYETSATGTSIGTVIGGNPATLKIEASIPIVAGSSELCGSGNAKWEGAAVTTSALYVDP